jgi:predicted MFS family arabinose efflux permease
MAGPTVNTPANGQHGRSGFPVGVMAMLLASYTLNFVDRQIIGILAVPIKADLGLTDGQLGLMGGLAFALFYSGLGIPIARLADRQDRGRIMAWALAIWSVMTALCGLATNFWQLFLARLGVGVGEAGGVAPAYSLIADLFPPEQRARALAFYSFGIPLGSASGIVIGGVIATYIDWRTAFFVCGLMGILLAPAFRKVVKDPRPVEQAKASADAVPIKLVLKILPTKPSFWLLCTVIVLCGIVAMLVDWATIRTALFTYWPAVPFVVALIVYIVVGAVRDFRQAFPSRQSNDTMTTGRVLRILATKPSFWLLCVGAASSSMMGYGLFFWLPSFLVRSFEVTLLTASLSYGAILLTGGIAGIWLGGRLADRLGGKNPGAYALIPAVAFVATIPFYAAGVGSESLLMTMSLMLVPTALGLVWLGPVLAAIQGIVPAAMRTTTSAIFLFINNLIGIGVGTPAIGWLSDALKASYGEESLRYAILAGTSFYVLAAVLLFLASRSLRRDWVG